VLIAGLLPGCASGPMGERPVVTPPQAPDPTSIEVPVTFDLRDGDRTTCSVRIEYSTDNGATWHDATILSSSAGVVTGKGSITGIRPSAAYSRITVRWDSWTDNVGKGGAGGEPVKLRVTPSDGDGVGLPAVSAAPFDVDNWLAKLEIRPPASVTFEHGLKNTLNPADGSFTIENTGVVNLNWKIDFISYPGGETPWIAAPLVNDSGVTAPGGTAVVNVSVDPNGADLQPGTYTAEITVEDPAAYGTPQYVTVTLTVSRPVMRVAPGSVAFDEVPYDLAAPANTGSFFIYNDGPLYTELHWEIDDLAALWPGWLTITSLNSGTIVGGGSYEVTLLADHRSPTALTPDTYPSPPWTLTVDDAEVPGVATIVSQDVSPTLPVRNQRPEILIHDGTGTPLGTLALACVEGQTANFIDAFWIRNVGEPVSALDWDVTESAGWLSCDPMSNAGPSLILGAEEPVTLDVDTGGLTPDPVRTNDYTATITVSGGDYTLGEPTVSGVDRQLVMELDVLTQPQIDATPAGVVFPDGVWGTAYPIPSDVVVDIYNINGEVDLDWTGDWYLGAPDWVTVSASLPASGQVDMGGSDFDTLTFTLNADAASLGIGDHTATFRFVNQYGTPTDLPVSFHVGYRDLIVQSITHSPISPDPGDNVTFTVAVRNQGDVDAGSFTLGFWSTRFGAPLISTVPSDSAVVAGPVAGGVVTRIFSITAPSAGTRYAWAFADRGTGTSPADVIEYDEGNNAGPIPSGHAWTTVATPAGDGYEDDDSFAQANLIVDGSPQTHSIHTTSDEDFVRFYVPSTSTVTIYTTSAGDLYLWLYDSGYNQITFDDDSGVDLNPRISMTLAQGWYYAKVHSYAYFYVVDPYTLYVDIN